MDWWLSRPYLGFSHDALFYAADVLRRVGDEALNSDLFFGPGTQGDFSVYPVLYAALVKKFGLSRSAFGLTLVCRLSWLLALALFCRSLNRGRRSAVAFGLLLLLPVYYDSHRIFSYGEPFETPRHWAETASLLALTASLRAKHTLALAFAATASAIHPLMGLPALLTIVFMLPARVRNPLLMAGLTLLATAIGLHLGPAARLFVAYDDAWFDIVRTRNPQVLLTEWSGDAISRGVMWVLLLASAATVSSPLTLSARRLCGAMAWAAITCLMGWALGCWLKNTLLIQLQLWRVLWLAQLLAPAAVLGLIAAPNVWRSRDRTFIALLTAALLSDLWTCLPLATLAIASRRWLPLLESRQPPRAILWLQWAAYALLGTVAVARLARLSFNAAAYDTLLNYPHATIIALATEPVLTGIVLVALTVVLNRLHARGQRVVVGAAAALPVAAMAFWIQQAALVLNTDRPEWADGLKRALPASTTVYWDAGVEATWMLLRRANYASGAQGSGALFVRAPAIELDRRLRRLEALSFIIDRRQAKGLIPAGPHHAATVADVQALCQDAVLDQVLLSGARDGATQVFSIAGRIPPTTISIFQCAAFRNAFSDIH